MQDVVLGAKRRLAGFVGGGWAYVVAGVRAVCGPSPIDGLGTSHLSQLGRCACERHEAAYNLNSDIAVMLRRTRTEKVIRVRQHGHVII